MSGHYLMRREILGPGSIRLICLCGWNDKGRPDDMRRAWLGHDTPEDTP